MSGKLLIAKRLGGYICCVGVVFWRFGAKYNFQRVTAEDASNLAAALERRFDYLEDYKFSDGTTFKEYVREFIDYCKAGSFCIG